MPAITVTDLNNAKLDVDTIGGVSTSTALAVINRLGASRRTLAGIEADANAQRASIQSSANVLFAGVGYAPPVAYAAGISMTSANQTVSYSGSTYAPKATDLPFTTSGTFETAKFRLLAGVMDADLRVADYAALRASTSGSSQIFVTGYVVGAAPSGIAGTFVRDPTDTTSADNAATIIVAANGVRWKRLFDGAVSASWFGASPSATGAANIAAFQRLAAYVNAVGGCSVDIPFGVYNLGGQTFVPGTGITNAIPVADNTEGVVAIKNCERPVVIECNGASFVCEAGMRFGAFHKTTGAAVAQTDPNVTIGYGFNMFAFDNNVQVTMSNADLDGNIEQAIAGGGVGDTGWQIPGVGVRSFRGRNVTLNNVRGHHHGLDGILTSDIGVTELTALRPITLNNCRFEYNGRQAFSWTGGNQLRANNCSFSFTGKNGVISSAPAAGVDIEEEGGKCLNGEFNNCDFVGSAGAGMLTAFDARNVTFSDCRFIGTESNSIYQVGREFRFNNCYFNGALIRPGNGSTASHPTVYSGCHFDMDVAHSPTGTIAGQFHNFDESPNTVVDNSVFTSKDGATLPYCSDALVQWRNCTFTQTGFNSSVLRGVFSGINRITSNGAVDSSFSTFHGATILNGVNLYGGAVTSVPWTPVLQGTTSNGAITFVGAAAVKIGTMATVTVRDITWTAKPVGGDIKIGGLPYANGNHRAAVPLVGFSAGSISGAAGSSIEAYVDATSSVINITNVAHTTGVFTPLPNTALGATGVMYGFTFSYVAD